jgi:hypothetical protein
MALDVEGRPICCEMWPGNTADVKTLIPLVKRMRERCRLREIAVVADRGMVSKATLEAFEKSDPPVRYILGVRMRRQKEVNSSVLGSRARWFERPQTEESRRSIQPAYHGVTANCNTSPFPTNHLPRRSLPRASLPLASFEAPLSCLRPHPKHQGLRRSGRAAQSPSRYNRWAAHRSR